MLQPVPNGRSAADLAGVTWRKSWRSGQLGNCVEAAVLDSGVASGDVAVRNSRHPGGPALIFTREEMASFLAGARDGEFDDLAC